MTAGRRRGGSQSHRSWRAGFAKGEYGVPKLKEPGFRILFGPPAVVTVARGFLTAGPRRGLRVMFTEARGVLSLRGEGTRAGSRGVLSDSPPQELKRSSALR